MKKIIAIFAFATMWLTQMATASPPGQTESLIEKNEKKCIFTGNNQAGVDAIAITKHHGGVACDIAVEVTNLNTFKINPTTEPTGTLPLKLAVTQNGKHGEIIFKNLNSMPGSAGPKYEGPGSRLKLKYS